MVGGQFEQGLAAMKSVAEAAVQHQPDALQVTANR